jgi:chromosome segregation ATPase
MKLIVLPLLGALWLTGVAQAQNPAPGKPASKPAADGKTRSLGTGTAGGPLLTRDELRTCFKQEEAIRTKLSEIETQRIPLDQDKQAIAAEQAKLKTERTDVDNAHKPIEELNNKSKAYSDRVAGWTLRVKEFNDAKRSGASADREREALTREQGELEKNRTELEAERARLAASIEDQARGFNTKAADLDKRVADWNQRNAQWNDASSALEAERKGWMKDCNDRRYREDDETAIKRGK